MLLLAPTEPTSSARRTGRRSFQIALRPLRYVTLVPLKVGAAEKREARNRSTELYVRPAGPSRMSRDRRCPIDPMTSDTQESPQRGDLSAGREGAIEQFGVFEPMEHGWQVAVQVHHRRNHPGQRGLADSAHAREPDDGIVSSMRPGSARSNTVALPWNRIYHLVVYLSVMPSE